MNVSPESAESRPCWFVRASYNPDADDQTSNFVYEGDHTGGIKSIHPGDRIAIKVDSNRKHGLPFDNRGSFVSVMQIKAIGTVIENAGDGRRLIVDWTRLEPPREWYFFTHFRTLWRVQSGAHWGNDDLIRFTFEGQQQDIDYFRNQPYWRDKFGDQFEWAHFYEALADKLLQFRENRAELVQAVHSMAERGLPLPKLEDSFEDGTTRPIQDICPFTTIAIFNRGLVADSSAIAKGLAEFLSVDVPVPDSFEGIPTIENQHYQFFNSSIDNGSGEIDALWDAFASAIQFDESDGDDDARSSFVHAYDNASRIKWVNWKLTTGLHWTRPWRFPSLDARSHSYISEKLGIHIGTRVNATEYLELRDTLEEQFQTEECPVHSFPALSLAAWKRADDNPDPEPGGNGTEPNPVKPYSIENILEDGCFLQQETLDDILQRLSEKKNLILQGPPGTGKTWLAKRLAYALMNRRDESKVRSFQFHPNLSYEDFVRGLRPDPDNNGGLALVDGPFIEIIDAAKSDPDAKYVLVIEEINRGQPAQIFGEMLTLLEADKRNPDSSLELTYRRPGESGIYIPDNFYLIGTMNIADRSLALVDFAFRRRFAFVDLVPVLDQRWSDWVTRECNIDSQALSTIGNKLSALNKTIADDPNLGPQFSIGHSFVTPSADSEIPDAGQWFRQVVQTEIRPLLDEYWFDDREQANSQVNRLLEGI